MSTKSSTAFPVMLVLWLLAMLGITFGVAHLAWGLPSQSEKFWVNFCAVAGMEVFITITWFLLGKRKSSRMIALDFSFAGIAGLYVLATLAITLVGLLEVSVKAVLILHLVAAAGFITLSLIFALGRNAAKASWEGMDARQHPMAQMRADLRRITVKVPADCSADISSELAQLAEALKYATDESFPGGESEDAVVQSRLIELNGAMDGLPSGAAAFHTAARRLKQAVEERETVMKNLRSRG
jgi:hypothetical protein